MTLKNNIEELKRLNNTIEELSVYDLDVFTAIEQYFIINNKINEIIKELNTQEIILNEIINVLNNKGDSK